MAGIVKSAHAQQAPLPPNVQALQQTVIELQAQLAAQAKPQESPK